MQSVCRGYPLRGTCHPDVSPHTFSVDTPEPFFYDFLNKEETL